MVGNGSVNLIVLGPRDLTSFALIVILSDPFLIFDDLLDEYAKF